MDDIQTEDSNLKKDIQRNDTDYTLRKGSQLNLTLAILSNKGITKNERNRSLETGYQHYQ